MSLGKVGKYELLDRLSAGGMGELFRARTMGPGGFERILALKVIRKEVSGDPELRQHVHRRGQGGLAALAPEPGASLRLRQRRRRRYYLAMEMVEGHDLARCSNARARSGRPSRSGGDLRSDARSPRGLDYLHRLQQKGEPLRLVAPRRQPAEHHGLLRRRGEAHRLRHRPHERPRSALTQVGRGQGQAGLSVSGAGDADLAHRRPLGPLLAGDCAVGVR